MSKQYLADMLKSLASGDTEAAKAHFSKYSTEKSQEILSRGEEPVAPVEPETPPAEPEVTPEDDTAK